MQVAWRKSWKWEKPTTDTRTKILDNDVMMGVKWADDLPFMTLPRGILDRGP